ncbi:MAG: hypothetical protein LBB41_06635 [Prevotellaceae bacterium]|jgi:hypothetical protein|nr:hypothetical protein [Prevotellaceae bacterium]
MNSYFSQLYLDILARIEGLIPDIKWIEQDFGQEANTKWRTAVAFPAALINFPSAQYEGMAMGGQTAVVSVSVRLICATFSQSYNAAPDEVKAAALAYFELEQQLVDALHGWQPGGDYTQPLMRTSAASDNNNNNGLRIRTLTFTTAYEEYLEDDDNYARI